jgi:3-hydroxyisobutyrate dehydrogenase-like beta-hydroxyacid dehydrogenase
MQVAVLGLGNMGRSIARRLLDGGHEVRVWNRTPGRASEMLEAGAVEADSPEEAVEAVSAALVSLADDRAVRTVVLESNLPQRLGDGVLVDLSTVAPETSRAEAEAMPGRRMVAAPVLGAPAAVLSGHAVYVLGGPRALVDELEPVWSTLSDQTRWWSEDPGVATSLKLLSNYLLLGGLALLAEAAATGLEVGLGQSVVHDFLENSAMVPAGLQNRLDDVLSGPHEGWFPARLGAKDVGLARQLAASAGLQLPIAELVEQRYQALAGFGLADADIAAVVELLRRPAT